MRRLGVVLPVEQPRLRFCIDGVAVAGAVSLEIEYAGYFMASRFQICLALGASPFATIEYFANLGQQNITIEAALYGFDYVMAFQGKIDNVIINLLANTVSLSGRDLSGELIDTEIAETFANQTASQIATTIAGRHNLAANVTETTARVGQYYQLDHARNALSIHSRSATEWNLLVTLAMAENFVLSVMGSTLNFGPNPVTAPVFVTTQNFVSLTLDSATALPSAATVKSWNSRQKTVVSESQGSGAGTTIVRPNLTASQAQAVAANHLAALAQHNTILKGVMPADLTLMPGMQIVLGETESAFDQTYVINSISRTLRAETGFTQAVCAYAAS